MDELKRKFAELEARMAQVETRATHLEMMMTKVIATQDDILKVSNDTNSIATQVATETAQIRAIWGEMISAIRFFNLCVRLLRGVFRWVVVPIALTIGGMWAWSHSGQFPQWALTILEHS